MILFCLEKNLYIPVFFYFIGMLITSQTGKNGFRRDNHDNRGIYLSLDVILCSYVTGIEDLCTKRDELHKQIIDEEEEKKKIQNDIRILTERLAKVNESLSKKMASRNEFDKTIAETEAAYMKVCETLYYL